jgi:hypothetical protein
VLTQGFSELMNRIFCRISVNAQAPKRRKAETNSMDPLKTNSQKIKPILIDLSKAAELQSDQQRGENRVETRTDDELALMRWEDEGGRPAKTKKPVRQHSESADSAP